MKRFVSDEYSPRPAGRSVGREAALVAEVERLNVKLTEAGTLRAAVKQWVKDCAYSEDDIVLGPFTSLDAEGLASLHALLDLADPDWRTALTRRPIER